MRKGLAIVKTEDQKPKRERDRIVRIETPPNSDWFVRTREQGRTVWYLRLRVTGMFPRRFGPFQNRQRALLALDGMIDAMTDMNCEVCDAAAKYRMQRRFQQTWGPVIEDDLAMQKGSR
jgi:hypothetical protein